MSDNPKVLAGSSHSNDNTGGSTGVPLGLGLGGLQPKVTCFFFFLSQRWLFVLGLTYVI